MKKYFLFPWRAFAVVVVALPPMYLPATNKSLMQARDTQGVASISLRARLSGNKGDTVLTFSPDGRTLATGGGDGLVRLWDVHSGELKTKLNNQGYVSRLSFSPDGRTLETGSYKRTIRLWDVEAGKLKATLVGKKNLTSSVAFSPDSKTVITASFQELVARLWDAQTGLPIATLPHEKECLYCPEALLNVAFSPDGQTIATSTDARVFLWNAGTWTLRKSLVDEKYTRVVRVNRIDKQETFSHGNSIYGMIFSPDGRTLATGSRDSTSKLWDVATGALKETIRMGGKVNTLVFSPDSKVLATGGSGVLLSRVDTGEALATLSHKGTVWSIAFSPDSKLVATFADNEHAAKVWDVASGRLLQTLTDARDIVAFSPDGRTLATGGQKGTVLLWNVR